jgi:hypothetical protein
MPRVAKAVISRTSSFPWYEWAEEFEWDDDEFQAPLLSSRYNDGQLGKLFDKFASKYDGLKQKDDK